MVEGSEQWQPLDTCQICETRPDSVDELEVMSVPPASSYGPGLKAVCSECKVRLRVEHGNWLRLVRRQRGLSQQQLADAVGLDRSQISRWEHGDTTPSFDVLEPLALVLGVDVDDLPSTRRVIRTVSSGMAVCYLPTIEARNLVAHEVQQTGRVVQHLQDSDADPACGRCGFLLAAMAHLTEDIRLIRLDLAQMVETMGQAFEAKPSSDTSAEAQSRR